MALDLTWKRSSNAIAVVGAYRDDVNGENSGSVYLFDTVTGNQLAKILPDNGTTFHQFVRRVAIDGNTVVVGRDNSDDDRDPGSDYLFDITGCIIVFGEVNGDDTVSLLDVDPFVDLFSGW